MKKLLFLIAALPSLLTAQIKEFTYVSDHRFHNAADFYGYTLVPGKGRTPTGSYEHPIKLGLVQFKITTTGLEVKENVKMTATGAVTEEKSYIFSIPRTNEISNPKRGYEFVLMDLNNADIQGHLRVFVNENKEAVSMAFVPRAGEQERFYSLLPTPGDVMKRDNKFFTHEYDFKLPNTDVLWKQVIFPFAELTDEGDYKSFRRLYPSDQVSFKFEERTIVKGKKEKLAQFIIIQTPDEAGKAQTVEWMIKKTKEGTENTPEGPRKTLTFYLTDEAGKTELTAVFHRTEKETLKAIEIGEKTYTMRPGIRKD